MQTDMQTDTQTDQNSTFNLAPIVSCRVGDIEVLMRSLDQSYKSAVLIDIRRLVIDSIETLTSVSVFRSRVSVCRKRRPRTSAFAIMVRIYIIYILFIILIACCYNYYYTISI